MKKRSTLRLEARKFNAWRRAQGGKIDLLYRQAAIARGQARRERNALTPLDVLFSDNERLGRLS